MLVVQDLQRSYSARSRSVLAIDNVSFEAAIGEMVCIVGPSGCGKTTLLKCLSGLLAPTAGEVVVGGRPVTGPPPDMAMVFQEYGRSLFPWLTVKANVELPLKQKGISREPRRRLVDESLASVGLRGTEDAYPWQLSGGMQQRVAIARALAFEPSILLMDEPFAAVDAQTRGELEDLVRELWKSRSLTIIFVTHDIEESLYLGDRVLVLSKPPTRIIADVQVDLPIDREQVRTRSLPRFIELREVVYNLIRSRGSAADERTGTGVDELPPASRRASARVE